MYLQQRLDLLERLRKYILSDAEQWLNVIEKAHWENGWFTPEFTNLAANNISNQFLASHRLTEWISGYNVPAVIDNPKTVGLVMPGNIPMVGFHDFLCVFVSGHKQTIKLSSKDQNLLRHLAEQLISWDARVQEFVSFADLLKGCDAYIATGSNNSSRYFDYYFGKYPNIIRRNRTSVAILTGEESMEDLSRLADDVYIYYGLGCRNVSKLYVPHGYDFVPLLEAFKKYDRLADHNKYKNNYDYQLALVILNKQYYMTNGSILLHEHKSDFSAISKLNYEYYTDYRETVELLKENKSLQCIVGRDLVPFGTTQFPTLEDYADGIDTMLFLRSL
jgi:hypothetical protein